MIRSSRFIPGVLAMLLGSMGWATAARAASISASPNPCPVAYGASLCTTTITWDATAVAQGQIWVSANGNPEQLFACGNFGTQTASWIQAGDRAVFTLYQSYDCTPATKGSALASVVVNGTVALPVFTMPTSASGVVGQNFGFTVSATGATSYSATGLPPGLSLSTFLGTQIQGVPTAPGAYTTTVFASNQGGTASQNVVFTFTLPPPPVITSSGFTSGTIGRAFSYHITATNNPTNFNALGLPAGLSVNPANGQISGTPTAYGNFLVTLYAVNAGGTGQMTLTLTVSNIPPVITSAGFLNGTENQYVYYQITAANNPTSYSATSLPLGLSLNPINGVISGIVQTYGIWIAMISATNSAGTATQSLGITILPPPPVITGPTSTAGSVGVSFGVQMQATNPGNWSASGLPPGLSISWINGFISGTPTTAGTFAAAVQTASTSGTVAATITITISPPPQPPVAAPQMVTTAFNMAKAITLTGSDPNSLPLSFAITVAPAHGSLTGTGANQTYIPASGFSGSDSFSFKVNNGFVDSPAAAVSISVAAAGAPVANPQSVATAFQTAKAVPLSGSDPHNLPLTYSITVNPAHGALSGTAPNLTYTPVSSYAGADSFSFKVNNGFLDSPAAAVSIMVSSPPAPTANPQSVATAFQTSKAIILTGSDPNNLPLSFQITGYPSHGSLVGAGGNQTYIPASGFSGNDSFSFKVTNGFLDSAQAVVILTVSLPAAPTANPQNVSTPYQTANPITLTGSDPNSLPLSFLITGGPAHGSLTGAGAFRTYTPASGFTGLDNFTFMVNNGYANSSIVPVNISVLVSGTPVANPLSVTTAFNTSIAITLTGSDPHNLPLSYSITSTPAHGTLSGAVPNLTYTPFSGFAGSDSFFFKVNNGYADSPAAAITLTITAPANQSPVARFTATPVSGQAPLSVSFNGSASSASDGTITAFQWDFGDGTTGTGVLASHVYATAGAYTAKLTVTNNGGLFGNQSQAITVQAGPLSAHLSIGTFSTSPGGLAQIPVQFTNGSAAIAGLQFDLALPVGISSDISAAAGPAATAAVKLVYSALNGSTFRVIVAGLNSTTISDGDVVDLTVHLTASASGILPLHLSNLAATSPAGDAVLLTGADGSITVSAAGALSAPSLQVAEVLPVNGSLTVTYSASSAVTFQWTITPESAASAAAAPAPALAFDAGASRVITTRGNVLPLAPLALAPGRYLFAVEAIDALGNHSAPAQQVVTLVPATAGTVRVFPNPWRADRPTSFITFDGFTADGTVKIFTVSGRWVRTVSSSNRVATWDLKNDNGDWTASGLYIYLVTDNQGGKSHGELAIIR